MFQKGDKVKVSRMDCSFGICDGQYVWFNIPQRRESEFTVIESGSFKISRQAGLSLKADALITDNKGNYYFVPSEYLCRIDPEIKLRYYSNDKDVTGELSDESKLAVRKAHN